MTKTQSLVSLALAMLLVSGAAAQAAPLYVQMTVPPDGEFFSTSQLLSGVYTADDFVVGTSGDVLAVTWQGENGPNGAPGPDAFHINFYSDPIGSLLIGSFNVGAANRSLAGGLNGSDVLYNYWANLTGAGFPVVAGTRYWISIVNLAPVSDPSDLWTWAGTLNSGTVAGSFGGSSWFTQTGDTNFTLDSAQIPEPATFTLVGLGLVGLLRARRRHPDRSSSPG
jgi:PEP-CTERM motif